MQPIQLPTLTVGPDTTKETQSAMCWKNCDPSAIHATSGMLATQCRYAQRLGRASRAGIQHQCNLTTSKWSSSREDLRGNRKIGHVDSGFRAVGNWQLRRATVTALSRSEEFLLRPSWTLFRLSDRRKEREKSSTSTRNKRMIQHSSASDRPREYLMRQM